MIVTLHATSRLREGIVMFSTFLTSQLLRKLKTAQGVVLYKFTVSASKPHSTSKRIIKTGRLKIRKLAAWKALRQGEDGGWQCR